MQSTLKRTVKVKRCKTSPLDKEPKQKQVTTATGKARTLFPSTIHAAPIQPESCQRNSPIDASSITTGEKKNIDNTSKEGINYKQVFT